MSCVHRFKRPIRHALVFCALTAAWLAALAPPLSFAAETRDRRSESLTRPSKTHAARRGLDFLLNKPYLPPDFDQETFDELWQTWDEPLRSQAKSADANERRELAYSRYGLIERPADPQHRPLQYVVDTAGNWSMNCLACHQGKVAGKVFWGAPNSLYAMQTLYDDVRTTKLRLGKKLTHMDLGSAFMPLSRTNGATNAVMFGVVLLAHRDADLNLVGRPKPMLGLAHHDHDAPPWWHFHRKKNLYIDGFAPKATRPLMQFLLVKENGPARFRQWERDFEDVFAYLDSLRAPKYPWSIDSELAARGKVAFERNCSSCHGTYGDGGRYPEKTVPIETVGTDRVRLNALTPANRKHYAESWFANYNRPPIDEKPSGYVAPPLDGAWASAPYFHNGSVPTLWHVLNPHERPGVWRRSEDGYDREHVGLEIKTFKALPDGMSPSDRRTYFDTTQPGKSAAGHTFPEKLSDGEKRAVLEYLKTL